MREGAGSEERARQTLKKEEARLKALEQQWKQLSDFIDEQRRKGRDVSDLMVNLRRISDKIQVQRARVVKLMNELGIGGSTESGGSARNRKPKDGEK